MFLLDNSFPRVYPLSFAATYQANKVDLEPFSIVCSLGTSSCFFTIPQLDTLTETYKDVWVENMNTELHFFKYMRYFPP